MSHLVRLVPGWNGSCRTKTMETTSFTWLSADYHPPATYSCRAPFFSSLLSEFRDTQVTWNEVMSLLVGGALAILSVWMCMYGRWLSRRNTEVAKYSSGRHFLCEKVEEDREKRELPSTHCSLPYGEGRQVPRQKGHLDEEPVFLLHSPHPRTEQSPHKKDEFVALSCSSSTIIKFPTRLHCKGGCCPAITPVVQCKLTLAALHSRCCCNAKTRITPGP